MKVHKFIMTKEDGKQPIEYWSKDEFQGRINRIYSGDIGFMKLTSEIPIPDDSIVCDFCNKEIETFPVPIFHNYALCPECFDDIKES